jgi:hypothetical protein
MVGIFIVNNNVETTPLQSLQPTVCIPVGCHRLILLFELGQALGRISAFALIELHRASLSALERNTPAQLASLQQKAPRGLPPVQLA